MNNWEAIKRKLISESILKSSEINDMEASKQATDKINFNHIYGKTDNELVLPSNDRTKFALIKPNLCEHEKSDVYKTYREIEEYLAEVKPDVKIGTISHGTHSIDYFTHYFSPNMIDNRKWISNKVMFVFEAPASNLGASYGFVEKYKCFDSDWKKREELKKKHIEEFISETETWDEKTRFKNLLSCHRWWLDRTEETEEKSINWDDNIVRHLQEKEYCYSITALMKIFGLAHVYATNLMRFELYSGFEKGSEISLNWGKAMGFRKGKKDETVIDKAYKNLFLKEVGAFQPEVILATANPYNYIFGLVKDNYLEIDGKKIPIYKILHPANQYITKEYRFCLNVCNVAKILKRTGLIDNVAPIVDEYYLSADFVK